MKSNHCDQNIKAYVNMKSNHCDQIIKANVNMKRIIRSKARAYYLHDEAIVTMLGRHEILELATMRDGPHALPGVGVRHLDDSEAPHALHPQRHLSLGHVPYSVGSVNLQPRAGDIGIEDIIGLGGEHLVAPAREAREHGVVDEGAWDGRDARPRALGHVA